MPQLAFRAAAVSRQVMPELPEVETVARGLAPNLEGRRIARLELRRPDLRFPIPEGLAARVEGRRVESVARRAKYVVFRLEDGAAMLLHLGMSGRVTAASGAEAELLLGRFAHAQGRDPKHDHVVMRMADGGGFVLNDPRRFGYLDYVTPGGWGDHPRLKDLGVEPLSDAFDVDLLTAAFAGKRTNLKAALLDQRIVAGLGNIYVCEALFMAGLSPRRVAGGLGPRRIAALVAAIKATLTAAIRAGGSSLRDYAHADGGLGYFQHAFQVYGREGQACLRCGDPVKRIVQSGRSTFYCGGCQG